MRRKFEAAGSTFLLENVSSPDNPASLIRRKQDEQETDSHPFIQAQRQNVFLQQGAYAPQSELNYLGKKNSFVQRQQEKTDTDNFGRRTVSESSEEIGETVAQFEKQRIEEFTNEEIASAPETMASMQQRIHAADQATGMKSAIVYLMVQSEEGADQGIDIVVIPGDPQYSPIHRFKPVDVSELQAQLTQLRRKIIQFSGGYEPLAQQLYITMIKPVKETLSNINVNHLHLVLDQELQTIPIAVLSDGNDFLVQKFSLSVSPSFSLTETKPMNQENIETTAYGQSEFLKGRDIPAVVPEVNQINGVEDTEIPEENQFNLDNLENYLQEQGVAVDKEQASQILHIATHGEAIGGDKSYLQTREREINIQELRERGLDFSAIEMVVLSGCEGLIDNASGLSQNLDEDREFGIGSVIWQQGAESVVGSLWQVSDEGTMVMMKVFYQILSEQKGLTRAQVLQEAQLAMIEGRARIEKPYFVYEPKTLGEEVNSQVIKKLLPSNIPLQNQTFEEPSYWSAFELLGNAY
ncbi:MAG: CHAT domain-containing protein [Spirulinaceae cyanobacterium]